ncbi:hypothetical protein CB1_000465076, partial [Camelus ferus]
MATSCRPWWSTAQNTSTPWMHPESPRVWGTLLAVHRYGEQSWSVAPQKRAGQKAGHSDPSGCSEESGGEHVVGEWALIRAVETQS